MTKTSYPTITQYRYHFNAFLACKEFKEVSAVVESIKATVQPDHAEYEPLLLAGRERWGEIWQEKQPKEAA